MFDIEKNTGERKEVSVINEKIERTDERFLLVSTVPNQILNQNIKLWYDDFTGKIYPSDEPILSRRMHPSYSLHVILAGEGYFSVGEEEPKLLHAGDAFYIAARQLITYYPNPQNPWKYCGISVDGTDAAGFFREIGWEGSRILPAGKTADALGMVLVELINRQASGNGGRYDLLAGMYRVMAILENAYRPYEQADSPANGYIQKAKRYLENHYSNPELRITDVAKALNISHSYLCRMFRRGAGCSANEYLARYRMSVARRLLAKTEYPVSEIAFLCGYTDPSHFSRMYKQRYGAAPSRSR